MKLMKDITVFHKNKQLMLHFIVFLNVYAMAQKALSEELNMYL